MTTPDPLTPTFDRTEAEMHPSRPAPAVGLVALLVLVALGFLAVIFLAAVFFAAQQAQGSTWALLGAFGGLGLGLLLNAAKGRGL